MIQYLAMSVTDHITWFPAKKGISQYFSPYTILAGKQIDLKKWLMYSLGDYVQENHIQTIKDNNLPKVLMQST